MLTNNQALEKFFQIRAEKQKHIINAAFVVFGKQGYRKASVADIAKEAGITKGMITYYFGSKKTLYLYLVEVIQTTFIRTVKERLPPDVTDFFERVRIIVEMQVSAIKEFPALFSFINSTYYETDPAVAEDLERISATDNAMIERVLLEGTDYTLYKPEFDPRLVHKFVLWASTGCSEELSETGGAENIDGLVNEFCQCLDMMKRVFSR